MFLGCCGQFYNHVSLVNSTFPTDPGEGIAPRSSNLSKLLFYASSRPQKLGKVGAYLERRLKVDMRRNRTGYVYVSLDITNALIDHCRTHINSISKNILRMIADVLSIADPDLYLHATATFVNFAYVNSPDSFGDREFADLFTKLVHRFCELATADSSDPLAQQKMHLSGLRAIKAVVSATSPLPTSPLFDAYASRIVPACLNNIRNKRKQKSSTSRIDAFNRDPLLSAGPSSSSPAQRYLPASSSSSSYAFTHRVHTTRYHASTADALLTDATLDDSAESALSSLASRCSAIALRSLLGHALRFLDAHASWSWPDYSLHAIAVLAQGAQTQHRVVLLTGLMDRLAELDGGGNGPGSGYAAQDGGVTLALAVGQLIERGGPAVGVAALEVLSGLVKQLQLSVARHGFRDPGGAFGGPAPVARAEETEDDDDGCGGGGGPGSPRTRCTDTSSSATDMGPGPLEAAGAFQAALIACIGALARSVEYPEQLNDVLTFLVNRLRLSVLVAPSGGNGGAPKRTRRVVVNSGSAADLGEGGIELRKALLRALGRVVTVRYEGVLRVGGGANAIALAPARRSSVVTRAPVPLAVLGSTLSLLADTDRGVRVSAALFLHHVLALEALEVALLAGAGRKVAMDGSNLQAGGEFSAVLHTRMLEFAVGGENAPVDYVAVAALVEDFTAENSALSPSQRRALGNLALHSLSRLASHHALPELGHMLSRMRAQRIEAGEWCPNLNLQVLEHIDAQPLNSLLCGPLSSASFDALEGLSAVTLRPPTRALMIDRATVVEAMMELEERGWRDAVGLRKGLEEGFMPITFTEDEDDGMVVGGVLLESGGVRRASVPSRAPVSRMASGREMGGARSLGVAKPVSLRSETPPSGINVADLKDAIAANGSVSDSSDGGSFAVISMPSSGKSKSNVRGLLKKISMTLEKNPKRSQSPSQNRAASPPPTDTILPLPRAHSDEVALPRAQSDELTSAADHGVFNMSPQGLRPQQANPATGGPGNSTTVVQQQALNNSTSPASIITPSSSSLVQPAGGEMKRVRSSASLTSLRLAEPSIGELP
ncbi:Protein EFR3 B [Irineochytrium annulatum]|nr:Protein EFR3 B [Irineochytrium annulatum]